MMKYHIIIILESPKVKLPFFQDMNAHGPLTGHNSDVEVGEITLADMSPDDIRAELKRLYLQLEIFKSKTICRDNPHISKRRGGRKAAHRRFSLQVRYGYKYYVETVFEFFHSTEKIWEAYVFLLEMLKYQMVKEKHQISQ